MGRAIDLLQSYLTVCLSVWHLPARLVWFSDGVWRSTFE